jgi:hypothetical protein
MILQQARQAIKGIRGGSNLKHSTFFSILEAKTPTIGLWGLFFGGMMLWPLVARNFVRRTGLVAYSHANN